MTLHSVDAPLQVITVNFNTAQETAALIRSLEKQTTDGARVPCIVVNNSTDQNDSKAVRDVCSRHAWVTVVDCPDNPGYFGGLNRGLAMSAGKKKGLVVVCNNDIEFPDGFVSALLLSKYPSAVKVVCPDVVTPAGLHQNPHIERRIGALRRFQFDVYFSHYFAACALQAVLAVLPKRKVLTPRLEEKEIHMGVGACYILTPSFFASFESLEYTEYLYGEEAFLSDQVHGAGGIVWFDPKLQVLHSHAATLSKLPSRKRYEFARSGYPKYRHML